MEYFESEWSDKDCFNSVEVKNDSVYIRFSKNYFEKQLIVYPNQLDALIKALQEANTHIKQEK